MVAESLRLSAVVEDKFSAPLKKLHDQLKGVGGSEHAERMKQQAEAYKKAHEQVEKLAEGLKRGLEPAFASVGIGAVGLTGALGAIVEGANRTGERLAALGRLSTTIKLSPQNIATDQQLLTTYGIATDAANTSLRQFAESMYLLEHRQGGFQQALISGGAIGQAESERLQALKGNLQAQFEEVMKFQARIKNELTRSHYAAAAFGNENIGVGDAPGEMQEKIEEARKTAERLNKAALGDAKTLEEAQNKLASSVKSVWDDAFEITSPAITKLFNLTDDFIKANEKPIKSNIVALSKDIESIKWSAMFGDFGTFYDELVKIGHGLDTITAWQTKLAGDQRKRLNLQPDPDVDFDKVPVLTPPATHHRYSGPMGLVAGGEQGIQEFIRENARAEAYSRLNAPSSPTEQISPDSPNQPPPLSETRGINFDQSPALAERLRPPKSIELEKADDSIFGRANAAPSDALDDSAWREKRTAWEKSVQSTAILLSMRDVSIDATRHISEWWRRGVLKGLDGALEESPESTAAAAALDRAESQSGYFGGPAGTVPHRGGLAYRSGEGGGDGEGQVPHSTNPNLKPYAGDAKGQAAESQAMKAAMDQLAKEGVPEANLKPAAALLTGQAEAESGLNPNKTHDGGTGYGIYGARLDRRDRMLAWLKQNGYPANSRAGQMAYMSHEAMTDPKYKATHDALMNASKDTLVRDSRIITGNFERPKVINDRSGATESAYRAKLEAAAAAQQRAGDHPANAALANRLAGARSANIKDISGESTYAHKDEKLPSVDGFIFHHTASHGTPDSVVSTLNQRGLGVQYVMGRDGKIYQTLPKDSRGAHILPSEINNLSNRNTEGMEVIANDDRDVTAAQVKAGKAFAAKFAKEHPGVQFFGHGEVNPSHKQATEGKTITDAVRAGLPPITSKSVNEVPLNQRTLLNFARGSIDVDPKAPAAQAIDKAIAPKTDAIDRAMRHSFGGEPTTVKGDGRLHVSFDNLPKGARTKASASGMFKEIKVYRGQTMPSSDIG